jgi:hypothetical protein
MTTLTIIEGEEGGLYIADYNGGNITITEEVCTMVGCTPTTSSSSKQSTTQINTLKSLDNAVKELPSTQLSSHTTHNASNQGITLAPNPTNGVANLNFQSPSMDSAEISVYNNVGQLMQIISNFQTYKGKNQTELDLSQYPAGLYHIRIKQGDETQTQRLQKI